MTVEISDSELGQYGLTKAELEEFESMQGLEAEYSKKSDFSKAYLAYECTKMVFTARAKEMKKGYFNFKYLPDGNELKMWVPDTRREYVSAVKALLILLTPELMNYKDLAKQVAELKLKEKAAFDLFAYREKYFNADNQVEETKITFMPEADTEVIIETGKNQYKKILGAWDLKVEHYWNTLVNIYDEIFEQLSVLMHSNNYFKGKIRVG